MQIYYTTSFFCFYVGVAAASLNVICTCLKKIQRHFIVLIFTGKKIGDYFSMKTRRTRRKVMKTLSSSKEQSGTSDNDDVISSSPDCTPVVTPETEANPLTHLRHKEAKLPDDLEMGVAGADISTAASIRDPNEPPVSVWNQLLGSLFAFMAVSAVSANTLVIKLNPNITVSWFLLWQGIAMVFIQSSLTIKTKSDAGAPNVIRRNWIGILMKLGVMFLLLPVLFRIIPEMPFGDLSVILTCGPSLLVAIFAFILFDEKLTRIQVFLVVLSSFGVVFIIRPAIIFGATNSDQVYPHRLLATLTCVGLACLITTQVLAVRKMGFEVNAYLLNTLVGIALTLSGTAYQIFYSDEKLYNEYFCSHNIYCALIIAISSILASFISPLETLALQRIKAAVYTSIGNSKVVLDYTLQVILFPDEGIFWSTVLGAIVVTITAFDLSLNLDVVIVRWFKRKKSEIIEQKVKEGLNENNHVTLENNVQTNC
ncbi:uncharacterized protein LOC134842438 isoform X2 [Symsagittifera roscoffensis]|uniref:uncharacterized protein LOC134842438 isoform X2 n=1 Tax=Symsagittifera roscoffensis TaxID=84072 RepID=UPI00307C4E02